MFKIFLTKDDHKRQDLFEMLMLIGRIQYLKDSDCRENSGGSFIGLKFINLPYVVRWK